MFSSTVGALLLCLDGSDDKLMNCFNYSVLQYSTVNSCYCLMCECSKCFLFHNFQIFSLSPGVIV